MDSEDIDKRFTINALVVMSSISNLVYDKINENENMLEICFSDIYVI